MKKYKILLGLGGVTLASSIISVTSCGTTSKSKINYDFGLSTEPLNNLNYVKYKSLDKVLPSLVDSFLKTGPSSNLSSIIPTNDFNMTMVNTSDSLNDKGEKSTNFDDFYKNKDKLLEENGYGKVTGSWLQLKNLEMVGGLGVASIGDIKKNPTLYAFRNPKNSNNYMAITGFVNNKLNRWSNGDIVTAQDIRDYLEYILDLSTGSQKQEQVKKFAIRGSERFINAQKNYLQKFGKIYNNPWGRRKYIKKDKGEWELDLSQKVWQNQIFDADNNPLDSKEVQEIKDAALSFGFYTGQLFLGYSNEEVIANLKINEKTFDFSKEEQVF